MLFGQKMGQCASTSTSSKLRSKAVSSTEAGSQDNDDPRSTIAIIGGGPAAMFFCHALEIQKKELISKGNDVSGFPIVQCFERAPGPGGVWRSDRKYDAEEGDQCRTVNATAVDTPDFCEEKKEEGPVEPVEGGQREILEVKQNFSENGLKTAEKTPNMYSALWTNGDKESFEFSDYTFRDHFGDVRMPTYLPRKYVLDYILRRCTRNCPRFFDKYFSFQTSVVNVKYIEDNESDVNNNKFRVQIRRENTGVEEIKFFDKCIWAGGVNGIPYVPKKLVQLFRKGGFKGPIVHSSNTTNFKQDVENKTVLIVGGGLSAEDLALMAIKEGVSHVHCTFRPDDAEMADVTRWPYDKVNSYAETTVKKVEGNTVTLGYVKLNVRENEYEDWECDEEITLKNIDTVIFCTGYEPNFNMLDESLAELCNPCANDCDGCSDCWFRLPSEWRMKKSKFLEMMGQDVGHIKPAKRVWKHDYFYTYRSNLYRGCISIDNPNMMYFLMHCSDWPLLEVDIAAWMLVRYATGQKDLPSREEMRQDNHRVLVASMDIISVRYVSDWKFKKAVDEVIDWDELSSDDEDAWSLESYVGERELRYRLFGEIMNEHRYPVSFLRKDGKRFSKFKDDSLKRSLGEDSRDTMHEIKYDCVSAEGAGQGQNLLKPGWKTFRDAAKNDVCVSYFTGIKSCPLPKPWFELDEDDKLW
mmetsp:Transcript_11550/g.27133  ORF Transcript_11550/g.27133 Transcript_11550/m.27133 type:complete len:695 (-) Transcript_11550:106-2190(-)